MFGNTIRKLSIKRSDLVVSSKIFNHYNNVGMVRTHFSHISPPVLSLIFGLILHCTVQGPNEIGLSRKHLREGMEGILDRLGDGFDYVVSKAQPERNARQYSRPSFSRALMLRDL